MSHGSDTPSTSTGTPARYAGRIPYDDMENHTSDAELAHKAGQLLAAVREDTPLVQCLTNAVVTNFTANALLAAGCSPAMTDISGEAGPFAEVASGVLINLGTPNPEQRLAMFEAASVRHRNKTGWVLDPVAIGSLPLRTALAQDLFSLAPTVVRGNASEILALAGASKGGRGVDSTAEPADAVHAAWELASRTGGAIVVTGAVDEIITERFRVQNTTPAPLLTRITGGGCAHGAMIAAFLAVADEARPATRCSAGAAAAAATAFYTLAASRAAEGAAGPGTFLPAFLDQLHLVTPEELEAHAGLVAVGPLNAPAPLHRA